MSHAAGQRLCFVVMAYINVHPKAHHPPLVSFFCLCVCVYVRFVMHEWSRTRAHLHLMTICLIWCEHGYGFGLNMSMKVCVCVYESSGPTIEVFELLFDCFEENLQVWVCFCACVCVCVGGNDGERRWWKVWMRGAFSLHHVYLNYVLYMLKQLHLFHNQHCLVAFFKLFEDFFKKSEAKT